jgi:hypothetical protein
MNPYIKIPLTTILPADRFVVKSQREIREYSSEGNSGSQKVIGQRYELVDTTSYELFTVKVPETSPSIPQVMIERANQPLLATLKNAKFSFYVNQGRLAMSFTAEEITLFNDDDDLLK